MADTTEEVPEQEIAAPAGNDVDSRKRAAKHALAAAEATGDTDAADKARKDLDAVNDELAGDDKDEAAKRRQAASDPRTRETAPQGRSSAPRSTTEAPATGSKK